LRTRARELAEVVPANATRLLFVGESTTFGLYVKPTEAYPAQVATLLEARGRRVVAFNRGVPSLTSGAALRTLDEKLALVKPHWVFIQFGANDYHTQYNGYRLPGEGWLPRPLVHLLSSVRIVRVIDLWMERRRQPTRVAAGAWLDERSPSGVQLGQSDLYYDFGEGRHLLYTKPRDEALIAQVTATLEANLTRMIARCRAANAEPVIVGYLKAPQENEVLRRVAAATGTTFVATWTGEEEPAIRPAELFTADYFHPSHIGHRQMAERIVETVGPKL
jgi:lysophospholipase L1-like esterase